MKKGFLILIFIVCLIFTSCSNEESLCYYGFFSDKSFALIYSPQKNLFCQVELPEELMIEWSEKNGVESLNKAAAMFCGVNADGIMLADYINWQAFCEILDAMGNTSGDVEQRLNTIVLNSAMLQEEPLLGKINNLLNGDLKPLFEVLSKNQPEVCYLDANQFADYDDLDYCQKYMKTWMSQIIN